MRNIRLLIEYDGTAYSGWQRQENGRTVQGEIETVLQQILQEKVNVIGAGRTDAGVHARGQVANFRMETERDLFALRGSLNGLLPDDIVVHQIDEVPLEFHARYSARERMYSYSISTRPVAIGRSYSWCVEHPLTIDRMRWAAMAILGEHDFQSFCRAKADVEHHRCNIKEARWLVDRHRLRFTIRADRFLHGMVRALIGTMVDVGRGYTSLENFQSILEVKDRREAGMAAPAHGLVLESVTY